MTNTSNLNLTKGTIPPLLKYKIVFLGDQAVGKSSIINSFIYDIFDGNEHVYHILFRDLLSVSILSLKIYFSSKRQSGFNFGILLVRKDFAP
jgi:GTPase SAR1 family protein